MIYNQDRSNTSTLEAMQAHLVYTPNGWTLCFSNEYPSYGKGMSSKEVRFSGREVGYSGLVYRAPNFLPHSPFYSPVKFTRNPGTQGGRTPCF